MLIDIADFSLHNAIVQLGDHLLHQGAGIPMGDPISPGMAIIVLAWMEKEWLQTLTASDKQHFCAARFMDDILMFVRKAPQWDHERFLADFARSECYHPPLTLVDAKDDTFLETTLAVQSGHIRHWLKNENPLGGPVKVWRYQHWASCTSFEQKRATLSACLSKRYMPWLVTARSCALVRYRSWTSSGGWHIPRLCSGERAHIWRRARAVTRGSVFDISSTHGELPEWR